VQAESCALWEKGGCTLILSTLSEMEDIPDEAIEHTLHFAQKGYVLYSDDEEASESAVDLLTCAAGPEVAAHIIEHLNTHVAEEKPSAQAA